MITNKHRNVMKIQIYENDLPDDFEIDGDLAIDTETMGLDVAQSRLCVLQFSNGNGIAYLVHFKSMNFDAPNLKRLLKDSSRCKIFHFARFDLAVIKKYLDIELQNIFCTKIASKLLRTYTDHHGLKDLCRELLDVNISKQQQSSYWGSEDLTKSQQEYAANDVLFLHKIREIMLHRLEREGRLEIAMEVINFLPIRVKLDLIGYSDKDIFAHS